MGINAHVKIKWEKMLMTRWRRLSVDATVPKLRRVGAHEKAPREAGREG